ncbi:hypothetical protein [Frankia sp. AgKG'84/4]|uniref:hypothetical protein n=1 Tax=Frankia sp. AgKG'84/4 TaxID=573490 RepID=UPI00200D8268|nr:hypothetical protein [Frankia sp. AgKG'84/4]MCL9793636.1 hypothetical protein [Frankia sp. AgKG'84/4]
MPGARPTSRRPAVGGHSRGLASTAVPGGTVPPGQQPADARPQTSLPGHGDGHRRRVPVSGHLVRRAAGLILGMAVLIPAATALNDSQDGRPGGPPPVAAATTARR